MKNYEIFVSAGFAMKRVYADHNTEEHMYSHLNAIERTIHALGATTDIRILENGLEDRWIEYNNGKRIL